MTTLSSLTSVENFFELKENFSVYYDSSDSEKEIFLEDVKKYILEGENEQLKKMKNIVERYVKNYKADFYVHDMNMLYGKEDEKFLWFIRENGTFLVDLTDEYLLDEEIWQGKHNANMFQKHSEKIYYLSDGKVKEIDFNMMNSLLEKFDPKKY